MEEEGEHPLYVCAESLSSCVYLINLPTLHKGFSSQHLGSEGEGVK